ncbi:MAG TPA: DUF1223 domain-containing protein [Dongiaceae bacterium]|nr:DUF1223 domain-containing protein [Dongiaceae bacterium]
MAIALGCVLLTGLGLIAGIGSASAQQAAPAIGMPANGAPASGLPAAGFSGGGAGSPGLSLPGTAPQNDASPTDAPASLVTPAPAAGAPIGTVPMTPADAGLAPVPGLTTPTPVVLELFTAEGCGSCLAADANLGDWAGRRSVLVLTYHVDYWDYIGWRDMKADPAFAQRQLGYVTAFGRNMVYTPQLIIGGSDESLGTDRDRLSVILSNSRYIAAMTPLRLLRDPQGHVFADLPMASLSKPATIWLVSYRRKVETDILTGENAGRHVSAINVVRAVRKIGQWAGDAERLPVPIDLQAGGDLPADALAVIANQADYGPVIAATAVAFDSLR